MSDAVRRETLIPAPPAEVWRALTDSDWLGSPAEILELEPGGELRTGDREGFVEEVEPGERLSFWWSEDDGESSRVEITLQPSDEGTLVVVEESRPLAVLGTCSGPLLAAAA